MRKQKSRRLIPSPGAAWIAATLCLAAASSGFAVEGDAGNDPAAAELAKSTPVDDAKVVAAMQKGIDYLLSVKKTDNWEVDETDPRLLGGETALALYALLHAGDSLQDNPEYHAKLNWRGKELAPAIQWIEQNSLRGTYATGLAASALTLLPVLRDEKPGTGVRPSLEQYKYYLLGSMRHDGGYGYEGRTDAFPKAWQTYFAAAMKGDRKGEAYKALNAVTTNLYYSFGGPEIEFEAQAEDLRLKQKQTKDARELAKIDVELQELQKYKNEMPKPDDHARELVTHKAGLAKLEASFAGEKNDAKKADLKAKIDDEKNNVKYLESLVEHWFVWGDGSNSQYGMLGAWALADWGIELPNHYWEVQDRFWRKLQCPDGSWPYTVGQPVDARPTMGVAGIASLFIAQEFVDTELRLVPKPDKNLDAGLAWLAGQYNGAGNLYYMYGVERVGLASGLKFFGTTDWYKTGATRLAKEQQANGSWVGGWPPIIDTSYALLFLARGRNPVVFNKLQYNGPWNARPRDDAYMTRWMSKRFEKPINWQVVNLQVSPEEWLDAPVLLITGSVDPKFTKEDLGKLRSFVNAGGMIFSTADGGNESFTQAMKRYAGEIVDKKYEMRTLPRNHELFSKEMGVDLPNPPTLIGMSNGVREIWIHSSQDIGADWQMRKYASKSFELGSAIYLYASGMASLRSKLQPLAVDVPSAAPVHTIELARVDYAGNSDPEPGAWARMAKLARANFKTQVNITTVLIAQLNPQKTPLACLTGTAALVFNPADVNALRAYLNGGGMLFIDNAGGGPAFANSCRTLIASIYPNNSLADLPPDHPIYSGAMPDGQKLENVEFRKFGNLQLHRKVNAPALQSIDIAGQTKILYSEWDTCTGFLGTSTWGITGYAPATSEILGRNILLYSLNPTPAAVPVPAPPAAGAKDSPAPK